MTADQILAWSLFALSCTPAALGLAAGGLAAWALWLGHREGGGRD